MARAAIVAVAALVVAAVNGRQLPGHASRAFASAGHVYPALDEFCAPHNTSLSHPCLEQPLRIGGWNLQRFGISKMNNPAAVAVIVQVIHNYDLIVLQEVTDSSATAVPELMTKVNEGLAQDDQYMAVQSQRIGRTSYKEQYVFVFKPSRLVFVTGYKYVEQEDVFQVEPYVALFSSPHTAPLTNFAVIPLHAKPSDAVKELDALVDVYDNMVEIFGITDAILLGDFNAGCNYVVQGEYDQMRLYTQNRFHWLISDHADTTTKTTSCPYDRIVVAGPIFQKAAYYKSASTYYFDEEMGIESNWTLVEDVSDHYPVGVMVRGSVPETVAEAFPYTEAAENDTASAALRVSVGADLPAQACWGPVQALLRGVEAPTTDACQGTLSPPPTVMAVSNLALLEWRLESVDEALTTLVQLARQWPQLVTEEAVAVLGYKAGHGALSDPSLYAPDAEPEDVRLSLLCRDETGQAKCSLSLSAATKIN